MKYLIGASIFVYRVVWLLVFSLFPENGVITHILLAVIAVFLIYRYEFQK
jgi:hypothetical protein